MERIAALLLFLPLVSAFHAVGGLLVRWIGPPGRRGRGRPAPPALAMSLGVSALALPLFALAAAGWLTPGVGKGIYALLAAAGLAGALPALRALRRDLASPWRRAGKAERLLLAVLAALASVQVIDGINYPLGGDQLAYHFPVARHMVRTQSLEPLYGLPASCIVPQNVHLYFAFGMQVHSDILGKLFATFWGLLSYGLVYRLGRTLFGRKVGRWALLVFAFTPWMAYKMHFPFVEVPLAAAVLTALLLFLAHLRSGRAAPLVAGGAMVGLALGMKQTAWLLLPALAAASFAAALRAPAGGGRRSPGRCGAAAIAVVVALVAGAPWYLRNLYYLGNPVWPLFGAGKYIVAAGSGYGEKNWLAALQPETLLAYLRTLYFNYGKDCFSFFSPFLLLSTPFLPVVARRSAAALSLLAFAGAGLAFTYVTAPFAARYWFPYFAAACPVLALIIEDGQRARARAAICRSVILAMGILVLGFQAVSAAQVLRHPSREALVSRFAEHPLAAYLRASVPPGEKVIYPYESHYIFPENVLPVWCNNGWIDLASDRAWESLPARLEEVGARYLVFSEERNPVFGPYGAAYTRTVGEMLGRGLAREAARAGDLRLIEVHPKATSPRRR